MLTGATWSRQKRKKAEEERRLASPPRPRLSLGAPSPAAPASAPKREQAAPAAAGAPRGATARSAAKRCPDLGRPGRWRRGALPGFPRGVGAGGGPVPGDGRGGGRRAGRRPGGATAPRGTSPGGQRRAQVKGRARRGAGDRARSQWPPCRLRRRTARPARTVPGQTGFVAVRASVRASVSVCARARARLGRLWVGVRACELACGRRGSPGLRRQPVDRAPGGKLPQPPGPPALSCHPRPGQCAPGPALGAAFASRTRPSDT